MCPVTEAENRKPGIGGPSTTNPDHRVALPVLRDNVMSARTTICCVALFSLAGQADLAGQETATPVQRSPTATITTLSGQRIAVDLKQISAGTIIGAQQRLNLDDAMRIDSGRRVVAVNRPIQIMLVGGGWLNADRVTFTGEAFEIITPWGTARLAPDIVAGIVFDRSADRSRFDQALADRSVESDTVIAKTSQGQQAVSGVLESIDDEQLILNYQGRPRPVNLSKVAGIVTADLKPASLQGPRCTVQLVDGGSLTGLLSGLNDGQLKIELLANSAIQLPWSYVASVTIASNSVAWLSDLEPASAEHSPLATLPFQWQRDRSADQNPLTLIWPSTGDTRIFSRGIGTRSASRLEFLNDQGFQRLVATVGIDAETQGRGNCEVSVWADGIQLWSAGISGRSDPVPLDVGIGDMNRITLVVRHGMHLDLGDHVDWAEIRFVKTDPQPADQ